MATLRSLALAAAAASWLAGCAQYPAAPGEADHAAHAPPGADAPAPAPASTAAAADRMAMMDAHMKAMREMHEKMSRASTPQERQALMAEHMKLMQDGMAMMGNMPPSGMGGMGRMGGMGPAGAARAPMDEAPCPPMMGKRMEMMQSMMQMMMDRLGPPSARP